MTIPHPWPTLIKSGWSGPVGTDGPDEHGNSLVGWTIQFCPGLLGDLFTWADLQTDTPPLNLNSLDQCSGGLTPLMVACEQQPQWVAPLLDRGADVHVQGAALLGRKSALMGAARCQSTILPLILAAGAEVDQRHQGDWTALMGACRDQASAVPLLIAAGADVNARSIGGQTPLMIAAAHRPAALLPLLEAGADPNAADPEGITVLGHVLNSCPLLAPLLLNCGANPNARTIDPGKLDKAGCPETDPITPLILACTRAPMAMSALLRAGADMEATTQRAGTALMAAARHQPQLVPLLLIHGATVDAPGQLEDAPGPSTVLQMVCSTGDAHVTALVYVLLGAGADARHVRKKSCTPEARAALKSWAAMEALESAVPLPAGVSEEGHQTSARPRL